MESWEERIKKIDRILSDEDINPFDRVMLGHLRFVNESIGWGKDMCRKTDECIQILSKLPIKNEDTMEEKKTKKMTKAEAFEWLKGKKVNAKDKDSLVQMKMFDCGIKWRCGGVTSYNFSSYLFINTEGFLFHCGNDEEYWKRHAYEEISADDILSLEIEECGSQCSDSAWEEIGRIGAQISEILRGIKGHYHVEITEDDVNLYAEGVNLYHSDPF